MTLRVLILIVVSALMTAGANLALRAGIMRVGGFRLDPSTAFSQMWMLATQPLFVGGVILYGSAAIVWFRVLSLVEVSTSYPILVGLTFFLVTVGSLTLFGEHVGLLKLGGLIVILTGIVMVARA